MLDTAKFLNEHFGDADAVLGLLAKHDRQMPTREAVRKWFARGSLTDVWLAELLTVLEIEAGGHIDIAALTTDTPDVFG